uniref:Orf72 n=1 Tax=Rhodomonas salina TaxID=3034 RepID=Q9G8W3_RHDSA|nr:orf72 [Rhodomonas salina]AAG17734.1 orf72 [Rhodomonas salina]
MNKFNLVKNSVAVQFTDDSILFIKMIYNKPILKFDRDVRFLKKWEFHVFDYKSMPFEEEIIKKFRNKFLKLF